MKLPSLLPLSFTLLSLRLRPKVTRTHQVARSKHINQYADSTIPRWVRAMILSLRWNANRTIEEPALPKSVG